MQQPTDLIDKIDQAKLPNHVAVIMDGNGRWAKARGLRRTAGHEKGAETVKNLIKSCRELDIKYLTLYAFSTENWGRPKAEVRTLMKILAHNLKKEIDTFQKEDICLNAIGNIDSLPETAKKQLWEVMEKTKKNKKLTLTLALSYGAREELTRSVKEICTKVKNNIISLESIDEVVINEHLYTQNLPDVDLLIRTSGEQRISNFLLWQIAYAELYFTQVLWPDFKREDFLEAVLNYQQRERRFGKTSEQLK